MSPAATRRYTVSFESCTLYHTIVLAGSESEAIAKAKALYDLNGAGEFSNTASSTEAWQAECLDGEVQS